MYVCMYLGSRTISLEEKCLPTLIQALTLTQTLTLPGGGAMFVGDNCPETIYLYWVVIIKYTFLNPIQVGGQKRPPPTRFSPVTSTNVGFGHKNFLAFSVNPFATLVQISSLYLVPVPNY